MTSVVSAQEYKHIEIFKIKIMFSTGLHCDAMLSHLPNVHETVPRTNCGCFDMMQKTQPRLYCMSAAYEQARTTNQPINYFCHETTKISAAPILTQPRLYCMSAAYELARTTNQAINYFCHETTKISAAPIQTQPRLYCMSAAYELARTTTQAINCFCHETTKISAAPILTQPRLYCMSATYELARTTN